MTRGRWTVAGVAFVVSGCLAFRVAQSEPLSGSEGFVAGLLFAGITLFALGGLLTAFGMSALGGGGAA